MSPTVSTRWSRRAIFITGLRVGVESPEPRRGGTGRYCGHAGDRLRLLLDPQRVVEFVEEAAERNAQRQLDDLPLGEMRAQTVEQRIGDAVRALPGGNR